MTAIADPKYLAQTQAALATYLETGGNVSSAAKAGGLSRPTIYKLLGTPEWKAAISEVAGAMRETLADRLSLMAHEALDTLQEVMSVPNPRAVNQIMAAKAILEAAVKLAVVVEPGAGTPAVNVMVYLPAKGSFEAQLDGNTAVRETS